MSAPASRPGSGADRRRWVVRSDRGSLVAMAVGLAVMLAVPGALAFRLGFFLVLVATVAQIVFSHLRGSGGER